MNWRGRPLLTHQTIVSLIAATTTEQGLQVECEVDTSVYAKGCRSVMTADSAAGMKYEAQVDSSVARLVNLR